jgi:hypothetical protein
MLATFFKGDRESMGEFVETDALERLPVRPVLMVGDDGKTLLHDEVNYGREMEAPPGVAFFTSSPGKRN